MPTPERLSAALAGRYRLERELGQGGMATVYLAFDLKHDRKVAIKVLKPELAAVLGAERFVVEIKTTAALSHPHILPLFDSGEADGFLYYVMPYIEGETIRERINRETQLGVDEAVKITTQIADALDYAHRHGVIHRDIKPENLLLHDGRPMVMDFGIALALSAAAGGRMTETGLSLGTPHYMSPEQATAEKDISARSDVYSLASVLYELLTGQPPHDGGSAQQVIMRIITDTPRPVTELRKSVPNYVAAAVAKALEKLPADRFATAREFADALLNPAFTTAAVGAAGAGTSGFRLLGRQASWRTVLAAGVLSGAVLASLGWALSGGTAPIAEAVVMRAELDILTRSDSGVITSGLSISPDGSMIVYAARDPRAASVQLYLRRLDDRSAKPIQGTEGAAQPTFSPDGLWIAFVQSGAIRRIPVGGVAIENVAQGTEQAFFFGLEWAADGFIYYGETGRNGRNLARVNSQGGTPSVFLRDGNAGAPEPLPGGKYVLYTECCGEGAEVRAVDIETGESQTIGLRARYLRYLSSGHLLLIGSDAIKAVPFDPKTLKARGEPQSVLDSVTANGSINSFAMAENGTAAYFVRAGTTGSRQSAALVDLAGNERRIPLIEATFTQMKFSPNGRRVAFASSISSGAANSWSVSVHDLLVGTTSVISREGGFVNGITWMPSGEELLVGAVASRGTGLFIIRARVDGSGVADTLWRSTANTDFRSPLSVSPDGRSLLLSTSGTSANTDLRVSSLDSVLGNPSDYLVADWSEYQGTLSPDGRWVAYLSTEDAPASSPNLPKVYVRSFPVPGERFSVSDSVGRNPRWAPDGKTIYYWRGSTLVAASVQAEPTFRVSARRDLFTRAQNVFNYDLSPDGKQFVMTAPSAAAAPSTVAFQPSRLVVVGNWIHELRRKLGEQQK